MKQFSLSYEGSNLTAEFDSGTVFWYRVRLIVDDEVVDERSVFWGTTTLRTNRPRALQVAATTGFLGPKKVVLRSGDEAVPFARDG